MASNKPPKKKIKPPPMPELDGDEEIGVMDFLFGKIETPAEQTRKRQRKIWDKQDAYAAERDRKQSTLPSEWAPK